MPESNASPNAAAPAAEPEFVISRVFDAPRELVFHAWTEPKHVARWWGPRAPSPIPFANWMCGRAARIASSCAPPTASNHQEIRRRLSLTSEAPAPSTMDCSDHPDAWHDLVKPGRRKDERNPRRRNALDGHLPKARLENKGHGPHAHGLG